MTTPATSRCQRCEAPIVFITSVRGRPSPCNPEQIAIVAADVPKPDRVSGMTDDGEVVAGRIATADDPPNVVVLIRISHFATCPSAASFRKPKPTT